MKQIIHTVKKCESYLTGDKTQIGLHWQLSSKESACNAGDAGLILGLGRSPGGGNDDHSTILAWRIPQTEEPGGIQSTGSQRVGHKPKQLGTHICKTQVSAFFFQQYIFFLPLKDEELFPYKG